MRLPVGALLLLIAATLIAADAARAGEHRVGLDVAALRQVDDGGDPLSTESFTYLALRPDIALQVSDRVRVRLNGGLALILNDDISPLPDTISNAVSTSASGNLLTLDAQGTVEIKVGDWTLAPGGYYHHQFNLNAIGLDLGVRRSLAGGDTEIGAFWNGRVERDRRRWWNNKKFDFRRTWTHNLMLSWTQNLSPRWRSNLSLQYTHMEGPLAESLNYVGRYWYGIPNRLLEEKLPTVRNRYQVNGRLRYAPRPGWSIGFDASYYADDWGIRQMAIEPSFEMKLSRPVSLRLWYRFSAQHGTRYFVLQPDADADLQTRDSDLGSFLLHSPGAVLRVKPDTAGRSDWELRIAIFGFVRNDGIYGFGSNIGSSVDF